MSQAQHMRIQQCCGGRLSLNCVLYADNAWGCYWVLRYVIPTHILFFQRTFDTPNIHIFTLILVICVKTSLNNPVTCFNFAGSKAVIPFNTCHPSWRMIQSKACTTSLKKLHNDDGKGHHQGTRWLHLFIPLVTFQKLCMEFTPQTPPCPAKFVGGHPGPGFLAEKTFLETYAIGFEQHLFCQ